MRKISGFLVLVLLLSFGVLSPTTAKADSILYTVQGTFRDTGDNFTLSFSVPSSLTGSFLAGTFEVTTTLSVLAQAPSPSGTYLAQVIFADTALGGLFNIEVPTDSSEPLPFEPGNRSANCVVPCEFALDFFYNLLGPQLFAENAEGTQVTFLTGTFPITPGSGGFDGTGSFLGIPEETPVGIAEGTVTTTLLTPEPSSLLLVGFGLCALGVLDRRELRVSRSR